MLMTTFAVAITAASATDRFATFSKAAQVPKACKPDDAIDQSASPAGISFEQPSDQIKLKKSPKTPVKGPDDDKNIGNNT